MSAARFVTVFVVDQTLVMVSRVHGVVLASSRKPPQMSTTVSPSTLSTMEAPSSSPEARFLASALAHRLEPLIARPVNVRHVSSSSPLRPILALALRMAARRMPGNKRRTRNIPQRLRALAPLARAVTPVDPR